MSILISPSDNTGWGCIGTRMMRSTGLVRTPQQPVSVRHYYRSREHRRPRETVIVTAPRRRRTRTVTRTVRVVRPRRRNRRTATVIM